MTLSCSRFILGVFYQDRVAFWSVNTGTSSVGNISTLHMGTVGISWYTESFLSVMWQYAFNASIWSCFGKLWQVVPSQFTKITRHIFTGSSFYLNLEKFFCATWLFWISPKDKLYPFIIPQSQVSRFLNSLGIKGFL